MTYNPVQHALIRAHVTLCREDEVTDWREVAQRLTAVGPIAITLAFGAPVRDGHLVTLPATGSTASFDHLRAILLSRPDAPVRKHAPHITVIHPRNGVCSDEAFAAILEGQPPFTVTFREVTLIAQVDGGVWQDSVLGRDHS
ncbi:MAG: 2'-5' RNA ligase family protein [Candidatus Eisenbacteria bacterium]|nr:2'-5' RNA ligase family protein [Candidatus Eisenbacteria bacterium]